MTDFTRKQTRKIFVGDVTIGGDAPIPIQSMTTAHTDDLDQLLPEIDRLEAAGCQIIRVTVPNQKALQALPQIKQHMGVPLVADIHFNYRLALGAIDRGADKIRINPGNIGDQSRVKAILERASAAGIPIRIGVNSGSLEKDLMDKYGRPTAEALFESARRHIEFCQSQGFEDIIVSLKSSDVRLMIKANRLFSQKFDYPLHLGVTEAGAVWGGTIKSAVGIGTLLAEGIGDTIRVSLTGDPAEEVRAGFAILRSLHLTTGGINLVSCPTCGRAETDVTGIVNQLEEKVRGLKKHLTVAVMGCAVNGPGEAREADLGVACGKHKALFFEKGQVVEKIDTTDILDKLITEIEKY